MKRTTFFAGLIRRVVLGILGAALVIFPLCAAAQIDDYDFGDPTTPVTIEADMLSYDRESGVYTAEGAVEITRGAAVLTADLVSLNAATKEAIAEGNVVYYDGENRVEADRVDLNIDTQTGILYNGMIFYAEKHFYVGGEELEKTGEVTYRALRGSLTSCDGEVPAWRITGRKAEVTVGGYAKVWDGVFRVKDVPVMYLPYGMYPVKRERQTGLLTPSIGTSSDDGFSFTLPFYWAINESMDATVIGDAMTNRGVKVGLEYRYALAEELYGQVNYSFIEDHNRTDVDTGDRTRDFRWSFSFDHYQRLPGDIMLLADINMVSDDDYIDDLLDSYDNLNHTDSDYLTSRLDLSRDFTWGRAYVNFRYVDDLDDRRDRRTVHRLPESGVTVYPVGIPHTPLVFETSPTLVYFYRKEGLEALRLNVNPKLSAPISVKYLTVEPWAEGIATWWWTDDDERYDNTADRYTYLAGVKAFGEFGPTVYPDGGPYDTLSHLIRPGVAYTFAPDLDQDDYPWFDAADRVWGRSELVFSLAYILSGTMRTIDAPELFEILYLNAGVALDFEKDPDSVNYQVPDTYVTSFYEARLHPCNYFSLGFEMDIDHHLNDITRVSGDMTVTDSRGDYLKLGYSRINKLYYNIKDEQYYTREYDSLFGELKLVAYSDLDLYFETRYVFNDEEYKDGVLHEIDDEERYYSVGFDYHKQCWGVFLDLYYEEDMSDHSEDYGFMMTISLTGLGSISYGD